MEYKDLKPCPLCGSKDKALMLKIWKSAYMVNVTEVSAKCDNCNHEVFLQCLSDVDSTEEVRNVVINEWNTIQ